MVDRDTYETERVTVELVVPTPADLPDLLDTLASWQREDAPVQLHPGDVGWHQRDGADATAAALRVWRRAGEVVAIGLGDGAAIVRMTVAPPVWDDDDVARAIAADLGDPDAGVLAEGGAAEVPDGTRLAQVLDGAGWPRGEAWQPLRCDLDDPVTATPALTVEVVRAPDQVAACTAVHRSAWGKNRFTDDRWREMAAGHAFERARCLLARDAAGDAVATLTVWGAGPGRPALLEPLGVHADHRRRGYGEAICRAAAAHARELGASSLWVCTPSALTSAVATYRAAGFAPQPERLDHARPDAA